MHVDVKLAILAARAYDEHTGRVGELEYLCDIVDGCPTIAIRGTEGSTFYKSRNWWDIIRDLRAVPWYSKHVGWAHAGMLTGAHRVLKDLIDHTYLSPGILGAADGPKLYITGHSLGAGVGYLLARLMYTKYELPSNAIEFVGLGTPNIMVSNPQVPYATRFYRNGDDIVTELLGRVLYKEFNHLNIGNADGFEPVEDHTNMREYIEGIEKYWEEAWPIDGTRPAPFR